MVERKSIWSWKWWLLLLIVVVAGYLVGKDQALRDNQADRPAVAQEQES